VRSSSGKKVIKKHIYMKKFLLLTLTFWTVNVASAQDWIPQTSGVTTNLRSVFFTDTLTGFAVGDYGTILKTTDGGNNWFIQEYGNSECFFSVVFTDSMTGYIGGDKRILKTTNGTDWYTVLNDVCIYSLSFINSDIGFGAGGDFVKTTDGGVNWTIDGAEPYSSAVCFQNLDSGVIAGGGWVYPWMVGFIQKTVNGGLDWELLNCGDNRFLHSVCFSGRDTVYAVGANGTILISNDFFTEDFLLYDLGSQDLFCVHFPWANFGYVVGDSGTIYKNNGSVWSWIDQSSAGCTVNLRSVYFPSATTGYIVGEYGTILKTSNGGGVGVPVRTLYLHGLRIFPNPANEKITLETEQVNQVGTVTISNVAGQEVIMHRTTGCRTTVNLNGLSAGVYIVRIEFESGVVVGKFVKQ
jgi:photosystem II stability/assembly factor-like uncharacterized protein